MIEPMKKVIVLAPLSSRQKVLEVLQDLSVLHLSPVAPPEGSTIESLEARRRRLKSVWRNIPEIRTRSPGGHVAPEASETGLRIAEEILQCLESLQKNAAEQAGLRAQLDAFRPMGRIDLAAMAELHRAGVFVRLYVCSKGDFERLPARETIHVVGRHGRNVYLASLSRDAGHALPLRELELPATGTIEMENRLVELTREEAALEQRLESLYSERCAIQTAMIDCENQIGFERARLGMGDQDGLCHLAGYCPVVRLAALTGAARRHGWALQITEPAADDPVPTLLPNSRWTTLFRPVMNFLGVTPGYREFDASGLFLVFFAIFFALIVGDAGYGLLMLATTFWASRRFPQLPIHLTRLFYVLAAATIVWGTLTGMWFGIRQAADLPVLRSLVIPGLDAFSENSDNLIQLSLLLGAVHLTLAHAWLAGRNKSLRSLADAGWGLVIWGLYFTAIWLLLGRAHPVLVPSLIMVGALLILLFGEYSTGESPLKFVGRGLIRLPLTLLTGIGGFSDIISYVRLFAVGVATREVAVAFNDAALSVGFGSVLSATGFCLIVVLGHGLNLLLAALGGTGSRGPPESDGILETHGRVVERNTLPAISALRSSDGES